MAEKRFPRHALRLAATVALVAGSLAPALAADERHLGSGIVFPGQSESTYVNATGLAEGGGATLRGLWLFTPDAPQVDLAGTFGSAGLGLTFVPVNDTNRFYGGVGVNLGPALLGVILHTNDGNGLDGDIGAAFNLGTWRVAGVVRSVSAGIDRVDLGVGTKIGSAFLELDVIKPLPFDSDGYFFDLALSVAVQKFSFVFGLDWRYMNDTLSDADLHAGIDIGFTQNLAAQLIYRPTPYHSVAGTEWAAGLRYSF